MEFLARIILPCNYSHESKHFSLGVAFILTKLLYEATLRAKHIHVLQFHLLRIKRPVFLTKLFLQLTFPLFSLHFR